MQINKILVVDDDANIRRIAEITLVKVGKFQVTTAASGADALATVVEDRPDLVILDVMMPGMDGPMTLAKMRAAPELINLPVIFMTAKVQEHELERLSILGAAGVILKPFDPMYLVKQIYSILESPTFTSGSAAFSHPTNP